MPRDMLMRFHQKRSLFLLFGILVLILGALASCSDGDEGNLGFTPPTSQPTSPTKRVGLTPDPSHHTFTVTWTPENLKDVSLDIRPIIPPKQLDEYPSSYIDVTAKFKGEIVFKTDDPYYQCFEALAISGAGILIFEADPAAATVAGPLFLVAYNKCGPLLLGENHRGSHLGMITGPTIAKSRSDYVVLYEFKGTPQTSGEPHLVFPDAHEEYTQTPLSKFVGNWVNVDTTTKSWNLVELNERDGSLLASFISSPSCVIPPCDASFATAMYQGNPAQMHTDETFGTRDFTLTLSGDKLHITTVTHFTDNSGRADFTTEDDFSRGGSTRDG
ncbi:hypothetical protein [Ktedonospora formicarum]|uniref:Lipoprotein n=1 Tax=Ktedonospora formicarum TaxID=2778364 RepID=A0A8J3MYQ2_9CHLR|nr:hypothetical protein [Ktedonospora formicarum]GHO51058.1 hypothetical protein KSX_92210 [Ktedonospora formicarum]